MRFTKTLILMLFFMGLVSQFSSAESINKVAYINSAKVFDSYYKTAQADKKLTKEAEKKNVERDKLVKEINKLKDEVELLSEKVREGKQKELGERLRAVQDFDRETRLSLQRKRDDMMRDIIKEMDEVIKDYGKKNGYDIIFDNKVLIYVDGHLDITDDIIKILNQKR